MLHRTLSALLLSTSLLLGCSTAARAPQSDAQVAQEPAVERDALRAKLAARRQQSVDRFLAYRDGRVYPINTYTPGLQHVWVDDLGNLCAAATIISGDWGRDAAVAAAGGDNALRLADVDDGALADWILTSGLTHHEIVAIQEPMMYQGNVEPDPEIERLFAIYTSVERQIRQLWDENLDAATDALMAKPALANAFLAS